MPALPDEPPVICLMGPTASGKSDLALELADRIDGEIVSVDSAQVYRGMDIGTAKPSPEELARCPHHLIDIRDPAETYSAADFARDALSCIETIRQRGRVPLLAGGTMLYFRALLHGLDSLPEADPALREQLEEAWARDGGRALRAELERVDPVAAAGIEGPNRQRIIRALEVYRLSGRPISAFWSQKRQDGKRQLPYTVIQLAFIPEDRAALHARIAQRFGRMLELGLVDEVHKLRQRGDLHAGLPSMRSVGYRQVWDYLEGLMDEPTMKDRAIAATRQLAKRQLTWLRRWPGLHTIGTDTPDRMESTLKILRAHSILIR